MKPAMQSTSAIRSIQNLKIGAGPWDTSDPFLFCVYHKDAYPKAINNKCEAPRIGNGHDFGNPSGWSMYHGRDRIPGFPQHPHRGFETITATMKGLIDHTDSLGAAGRYGEGDNQWMTAGKGIVHSEMFPLVNEDKPNHTQFFQIWLNLPKKSKFVDPHFTMHWKEELPIFEAKNLRVRVFAGEFGGKKALPPPPSSWANDPKNEVAVWVFESSQTGPANFQLPVAKHGSEVTRTLYFCEGQSITLGSQSYKKPVQAELDASRPLNVAIAPNSIVLVLQGRPIGEPVVQHGPFVMNSSKEIWQAYADYRKTGFGGWPWDQDVVVHGKKGRFALEKGKEYLPPAPQKKAVRKQNPEVVSESVEPSCKARKDSCTVA